MSLNANYPTIKASDIIFREEFLSPFDVAKNGGTFNGNASVSGGVASFDGTGDFIEYTGQTAQEATGLLQARSIKFWVKTTSQVTDVIFEKGTDKHFLVFTAAGEISFRVAAGGASATTTSSPTDGAWHHIVATYDGATTANIYVDGVLDGGPTTITTAPASDSDTFVMGARSGGTIEFTGDLKEVAIFSRELTAQEVLDDFNGSVFGHVNRSVAHYPLHDKIGSAAPFTTTDISQQSNTGTLGDGSTAATFPTKLTNKNGYSFDGGDYINTGVNVFNTLGATAITIAMWIDASLSDLDGSLLTLLDDSSTSPASNNGFFLGLDDRGGGNPTNGINFLMKTVGQANAQFKLSNVIFGGTAHIVVAYDSSTGIKIYVDGRDTGATGTDGSGDFVPSSSSIHIGSDVTKAFEYVGSILDTKLFDFALTPTQVIDLFLKGPDYLGNL